jgi:iron complex transport system ATP-binding protein
VVAGGGAGSPLLDQLVSCGFAPTVGIVSVFDTDYEAAQKYELAAVSAPPFKAFPADAIAQHQQLIDQADVIVVAPVWFGPGNLEQLAAVTAAARAGKKVVVIDDPPISERDLSDGAATSILTGLETLGATTAKGAAEVMELLLAENRQPEQR